MAHLAAVLGLDAVQAQVLDEQRVGVLRNVRRVPRQQLQQQLHLACSSTPALQAGPMLVHNAP